VKVTSNFRSEDWIATGVAAVVAAALAYWGFLLCADCGPKNPLEIVSAIIALLRFSGRGYTLSGQPWQLVVAQYLVPAVAAWAAFKFVVANLRRDVRAMLVRRYRRHVIVCGIGSTGRQVAEAMTAAGFRVAAIDLAEDGPEITACETLRIPVLRGDARLERQLEVASLQHARAMVICCGEDSLNLDIGLKAATVLKSLPQTMRPTIRPGGDEPTLILPEMRQAWLLQAIASNTAHALAAGAAEIRPFNTHRNAARLLLRRPSIARCCYAADQSPVLVLLGFGHLGLQIVRQSIHMLARPHARPHFVVIDADATEAVARFRQQEPAVDTLATFETLDASLKPDWPMPFELLAARLPAGEISAVVACAGSDGVNLRAALECRAWLDRAGQFATPLYYRLERRGTLGPLSLDMDSFGGAGDRLCPFGASAEVMGPSVLIDDSLDTLPRLCHAQYVSRGDAAASAAGVAWSALPEAYKESNRLEADHIELKLRLAGLRSMPAKQPRILALTNTEIDNLAQSEHHRWLVERTLAGWRHGPRDEARRLHPLLCDWAALPEETRGGLRARVADLPVLLATAAREVRRERIVPVTSPDVVTATNDQQDYPIYVIDAFDAGLHGTIADIAERRDAAVWLTSAASNRPLHKAPRAQFATEGSRAVVEGWWPVSAPLSNATLRQVS
jgi:voltage-gated potassium channel Kch